MSDNILILACVSGFLDKFERENVRILKETGFNVHYAANMKEQHYIFDPAEFDELGVAAHHIDIERSPYMTGNYLNALPQTIEIIRQKDIRVIHCHEPVGGVIGRLAGRWCCRHGIPVKVIYTVHGFHFYKGAPLINNTIYRWAEMFLAHYTDILITINREDYTSGQKLGLKKGGKVYRIPGVGLDMEHFVPLTAEERKKSREKLGIGNRFFLVSSGELNENKNQRIVLQALKKMRDDGKDISGILYGICGDGFFHDRMEEWIREMDLQDNVVMFGYCMDVRPFLGCADASIFPSHREGMGMAGLEALSMEIPLIASDNRGTREYMVHKENGFVCDSRRVETVVEGIEYMMAMDSAQREKMKKVCRRSVRPFEKKCTNEIMQSVYQMVANSLI